MEAQPGFASFQLMRPVAGEERHVVVSTWDSEPSYQAWRTSQVGAHHGGENQVATGAQLLEFEVPDL